MWRLLFLLFITPAAAQSAGDLYNVLANTPSVQSVCPTIAGTSVGDPNDKSTWQVQYISDPSSTCQSTVAAVIAAFHLAPTTVQITSNQFPSLNGTYSIDSASMQNLQALASYVAINGTFPAGQSVQIWLDTSQVRHAFSTTTEWQAFAKAMADFYAAVNLGSPPSQPVAIP